MTTVDLPFPVREAPAPATDEAVDADRLAAALSARVRGEVRFDAGTRGTYATDASNYRQPPLGVVLPRDPDDAVEAVAVCHALGAPVLSRGGGTSLAGQCTNAAVVLDWTKYGDRIEHVDPDRRTAVVQPGVVLDDLNAAVAAHGLQYGPRPSTHVACTFGGMLGNNSCGATAQAFGKAVDNVHRLEVLTYDGVRMWVGPTSDEEYARIVAEGGRRAEIHRQLRALRDTHLREIRTGFPAIPRRVSGYNLDALLPENGFDVARALVGSEGTCVTVLRAEVPLVPSPPYRALVVLGYEDVFAAADAVPRVVAHEPYACEGLDDKLIGWEREKHLAEDALAGMPVGSGWLMVQFGGETQQEAEERARALLADLGRTESAPSVEYLDDPEREEQLWKVREAGLGATARPPGKHDTWEGWEDSAVAPEDFGRYLRDLHALMKEFGYADASALYGHFGQGCLHTRIPFHMRSAEGVAGYRRFLERAADLVASYGGSFSGEHGDGQSRGELLPRMYGDEVMQAFGRFKAVWDPDDRMNPGKLVAPYPLDANLRLGADYHPAEPETHFAFPHDDGRFSRASLRCVGIGKCRSHEGGVMCPSYRVTREEEHSTRGRARLLYEMLQGDVVTDGWRSTEVKDALDLCLACKGCRGDCPVNVDMATYKAEFLSHHYEGRLRPPAHYSMGWLPLWARLASYAPRLVNAVSHAPGLARVLKRAAGVAPEREVPAFAEERFTDWFTRRERARGGSGDGSPRRGSGEPGARSHEPGGPPNDRGEVVLWPDTFSNSMHPSVAKAAVEVLEDAGFRVRIPARTVCCGLTWVSTGQLDTAKRVYRRTVDTLREDIRAGTPVVGLEPSCTAVLRVDAPELLHGDEDVERLARQTYTLAELLEERAPDWQPPRLDRSALVQLHCHQHSVLTSGPDFALMKRAGLDAEQLDDGCCGLAGNFGFERGHYDVSMACAEDQGLLPHVREAPGDTVVLADGFSCRTQIDQGDSAGRGAVHLAELLAAGLRGADLADRPEHAVGERPAPSRAASRAVTGSLAATAGAVAVAAVAAVRRR